MSIYEQTGSGATAQIETDLYGSSRLGLQTGRTVADQSIWNGTAIVSTFTRGEKIFELSNHLGNVLVTVNDKKVQHTTDNVKVDYYEADVVSANDYYPFGMGMPGRGYNAGSYRYGFNGKEKDNEVKGEGNSLDFGARIYDPRIGRWFSTDPLQNKYPGVSPYVFVRNSPLVKYDPDGKTDYTATVSSKKNKDGSTTKTVTVDIIYAIINLSNKSVYNANDLVGDINGDETFSTSFTEKDKKGREMTVNIVTNVHYKLVDKISDVKKGQNVALIVDEIYPTSNTNGVDPVGLALHGGNVMTIESGYMLDRGAVRHEQGHNLGFLFYNNSKNDITHSKNPSNYMHSHSATGKNKAIGKTEPEAINPVFKFFAQAIEGPYISPNKKDVKGATIDFINNNSMKYDKDKAKKAGLPE